MDRPNQSGELLFRRHHHKCVILTYRNIKSINECLYDSTGDFSTEHTTLLGMWLLTTLDKNHPLLPSLEIGNELSIENQITQKNWL